MGRALYRESGPSQDGDPDTGNLPFFFSFLFLYFIFFFNFLIPLFDDLLILYQAFKQSEVFLYTRFSHHYTRKSLPPVWRVYPLPTLFN